MEKKEDQHLSLLTNEASKPPPVTRVEPSPAWFSFNPVIGLLVVVVILQGFLLVSVLNSKRDLTQTMETGQTTAAEQLRQTQALGGETGALTEEVSNLRQFLASKTERTIIFLKMMVVKPDLDPQFARTVAGHVSRYAEFHGQDPDLVLAIMAIESNFKPNAVSSAGALGIMQIMPQWKKVLGISEDLKDPETSVKYGLQIFGFYKEMYKETEMALTAYNRGPGPVDMALMRGKDHRNGYSDKVLKMYDELKALSVP